MLNARLAPGPCDPRLILQLNISSNMNPTRQTGMTKSAPPAYNHINAFSLQSSHCLPELARPERRSSHAGKPRDLLFPRCCGARTPPALWDVAAQLLLLLSAGGQAHTWSLETQLGQHAQGWKEDKSQTYGIPPLFYPLIFPLAACV